MKLLYVWSRSGSWRHSGSGARLLALFLCWTAVALAQPAPPTPHVHFIATGGTISNREGGRLTAEDLVAKMPAVDRYARVTYEQFSNLASSELTVDQWLQLSRRINDTFAGDKQLAGIVVTSGTDTLEETAFFLHLTVRDARPVVLVGAMRNASTIGYEGPANLLEGVRVAADPAARDKGVLVVLNDEINSAREVTKTDAHRLQTFQSRPVGVLGIVDSDRVVFYRQIVQRHTAKSEFDISQITELPRVDVIMVYQSAPGDLIKAAVDAGAKGIVMATAGAGRSAARRTKASITPRRRASSSSPAHAPVQGAFRHPRQRAGVGRRSRLLKSRLAAEPSRLRPKIICR